MLFYSSLVTFAITAPTSGVLPPREEKTILIEFMLSAYPSPDEKKDRFKIVTVPIPDARVNDSTIVSQTVHIVFFIHSLIVGRPAAEESV